MKRRKAGEHEVLVRLRSIDQRRRRRLRLRGLRRLLDDQGSRVDVESKGNHQFESLT